MKKATKKVVRGNRGACGWARNHRKLDPNDPAEVIVGRYDGRRVRVETDEDGNTYNTFRFPTPQAARWAFNALHRTGHLAGMNRGGRDVCY